MVFPRAWKTSIIIPRHKSGPRTLISNYRPIHHTAVASRIMERVINVRLLEHISSSYIHPSQHGFLSKKSCDTCLMAFMDTLTSALDRGLSVIVLYLDMEKAFDRVPHGRLIDTLRSAGVVDPLHGWIKSFLSDRHQTVRIQDTFSQAEAISSGVIQGSVLGPALFLIYINDIFQCFSSGTPFLFADDCKVIFASKPSDLRAMITAITSDLAALEKWSQERLLRFNPLKSSILLFHCNIPPQSLSLHGHPLNISSSVRDLGLYYSPDLKLSEHVFNQTTRARRQSFLILRHFQTTSARMLLYKLRVRPILDYGGFALTMARLYDLHSLESVQRSFSRSLEVRNNLTYRERCLNFHLDPLWFRRLKLSLSAIFRLFTSASSNLSWFNSYLRDSPYPTRNNSRILHPPTAHRDVRARFFLIRLSRIWNALPHEIRHSGSNLSFKRSLNSHLTVDSVAALMYVFRTADQLYTDGLPGV